MHRLRHILKSTGISLIIAVQIFAYPAVTFADTDPAAVDPADSTPTSQTTTEPLESTSVTNTSSAEPTTTQESLTVPAEPTTGPTEPTGPQTITGPTQPTGVDSSTYHQNPDGTWENDLYIWDPVTGQTRPKTPQTYSYNPVTKMWDTTEWYYSPETGKYVPNTVSVAQNPQLVSLASPSGASISQTGPNSNNNILLGDNTTGTFDLFFDARISNAIGQMSRSGDALVSGNTFGGSAMSGDAQSIANILNLLQSSWGTLGSDDISTFVANIDGNVVGDLYIDPSLIPSGSGNSTLDVNVAANGQINNDVNLGAESGSSTVSNNTTGGDATTGDASAVANLLNLINSAITANKSFVGVLNINGDLEGDILLPAGLLESIIASTGPNSNNTITDSGDTNLSIGVDTNRSIVNDVTTDASSGDATVSNNTGAGSATSGNTDSNITLLNLTGQNVVSKNALLVFVNVFGKWVGLIMNAPEGSNAVAATGPNSNNTIDSQHDTDIDLSLTENSEINNRVRTSAQSGDASVTGNTTGGNARSGDAYAGANILNMIDSSFDISDWFGVLFINVFGTWHGSFGVNTPYGDKPVTPTTVSGNNTAAPSQTPASAARGAGGVFNFVPTIATGQEGGEVSAATTTNVPDNGSTQPNSSAPVLTATTSTGSNLTGANWTWTLVGVSSALTLLGLERYLTLRRRII